jgi:hypothetical protein
MLDANPFAAVQQAGGPGIEQALPLAMDQLVHHRLRLGQVIDAHEAVVALLEADARPLHAAGQVLASIKADLNAKGQPGGQPHVHEPKFAVHGVEVQVQALAFFGDKAEGSFALADGEAHAGLDAAQHADQPLFDAVARGDVAGKLLFGLAAVGQVDKRGDLPSGPWPGHGP